MTGDEIILFRQEIPVDYRPCNYGEKVVMKDTSFIAVVNPSDRPRLDTVEIILDDMDGNRIGICYATFYSYKSFDYTNKNSVCLN